MAVSRMLLLRILELSIHVQQEHILTQRQGRWVIINIYLIFLRIPPKQNGTKEYSVFLYPQGNTIAEKHFNEFVAEFISGELASHVIGIHWEEFAEYMSETFKNKYFFYLGMMVIVHDADFAAAMKEHFHSDEAHVHYLNGEEWSERPFITRSAEHLVRPLGRVL